MVILVPMLGRAHTVAPLLESIDASTPGVRVLFLVTPGDTGVHAAIDSAGRERLEVPWHPHGDYARKINTGYRATTEPLIFLGACDLRFHPGWLQACRRQLTPGVGVVGTNDLGSPRVQAGKHATHTLVVRAYADDPGATADQAGQVLHEGYVHEYVDDELVGVAQHRGVWAFAPDARVEHLHPDWGKAPRDALYNQQRQRMRVSVNLFRYRSRLWR